MPRDRYSPFDSSSEEETAKNDRLEVPDQNAGFPKAPNVRNKRVLGVVRSSGRMQVVNNTDQNMGVRPVNPLQVAPTAGRTSGYCGEVYFKHTRLLKTLGIPPVPNSWVSPTLADVGQQLQADTVKLSLGEQCALAQIESVDLRLCYGDQGCSFIEEVLGQIEKGRDDFRPAVFKVGITAQVDFRAAQYRRDNFDSFRILAAFGIKNSCRRLETELISHYKGTMGCRNEKPGGEGNMYKGPPWYVYAVFADASKKCRIGG